MAQYKNIDRLQDVRLFINSSGRIHAITYYIEKKKENTSRLRGGG